MGASTERPNATAPTAGSRDRREEIDTRLRGRWLLPARVGWVIVVALALGLFVASIPTYLTYLHQLCSSSRCLYNGQLTPTDVHQLDSWGLSLDVYATIQVAIIVVEFLVFAVVGVVVFWRRSDDWLALLTSFYLVLFPLGALDSYIFQTLSQSWWLPVALVKFLGEVSAFILGYIFPSGHFVPRWTRWLVVALIPYWLVNVWLPSSPPWSKPLVFLNVGLFLGWIGTVVVAQTYRYRSVSGPVQRQQTKWVVLGASVGFGCEVIGQVLYRAVIPLLLHDSQLAAGVVTALVALSWVFIPLSLAVAVLRYRLWDVDVLINRTLVYGGLSAILIAVYVVSILVLQSLFRALFHQTSDLAIVVSTLVIAALFQPLRTRLQTGIDRRFYRSKYDAARLLSEFGSALREEVELSQLCERLLGIVQETMEPAQVWLWLRPREPSGPLDL
jgi:hypothetical protein